MGIAHALDIPINQGNPFLNLLKLLGRIGEVLHQLVQERHTSTAICLIPSVRYELPCRVAWYSSSRCHQLYSAKTYSSNRFVLAHLASAMTDEDAPVPLSAFASRMAGVTGRAPQTR